MAKRILLVLLCVLMILPSLFACNATQNDRRNENDGASEQDMQAKDTEKLIEGGKVNIEGFVITEDNQDKCKIVCTAKLGSKARLAADDLRAQLRTMTGWNIKIINGIYDELGYYYIVVGENKITESLGYKNESGYPSRESVTVSQKDNFLVLMGNDDGEYNGTQYAVTALLEHLGCGWFADDPLWTVIPQRKELDLEIGELYLDHTPRFSSRRTRVATAAPELAKRWYQGGERTLLGHWLPSAVPKEEYETHPEWFALTGGTRDPEGITYWQFCYSNKEFAARIAEEALKKFEGDPTLLVLSISANDGWCDNWCECENCKMLGNASDVMVHFANNVAEKVAEVRTDRRLQILSYHNTYLPPENNVKLHECVELMLCRETNMYKPLDEDFLMPSGKDPISHIEFTQSWRQNALEYIEKTQPSHISVWDWYCIAAERADWKNAPWVQGEVAIRNQKLYEELGAEYVFYDHGPLDDYGEPNTAKTFALRWPLWYVAAKASFDGSLDERAILDDACSKLYGIAGEKMLEYYLMLSDISKNCDAYSNTWIPAGANEVYDYATRKEIKALCENILELSKSCTEKERQRIEAQLGYWFK
ncbi:MAG: DUF4838 domain-containing protein [Ruminococcaceae bacterium]|nr:DUF4838 domain-containing protein [Oscillospiraceae bacterium]